ncbi:tetratricopeptide repeat protein [Qipengyuania atrilutea]|uniref:Tetratricopeptide repeat protein n=1 Tax=Qipengyuania atrilutea TaxID=2744473 RepID=A0A850GYG8_9SPHN|nr:tetratricopeptide repeat protein [Actirhodobacter atriluteus]NVD43536.1 tetratricopeptide repeat protein [Actirhodobacter atriluteus]
MKLFQAMPLALTVVALGGCQVFSGNQSSSLRSSVAQPDVSSYFAQLLQEGRMHLRANRPGAAITAFRRASYDPASTAEAYNGLAIAYDRLGRHDVAEQFFARAVEADPTDERFARNASRFETVMLARQEREANAQLAKAESERESARAEQEYGPASRMQRVSTREVHIAARSEAVVAEERASNNIRTFDTRTASGGYPLRLALSSDRKSVELTSERPVQAGPRGRNTLDVRASGEIVRRATPVYPIRVALRSD